MELSRYIQEAVSHGRFKSYNRPPDKNSTVEDIARWLEGNGVEGHSYDETRFRVPKAEEGKLLYVIGPCDAPGHYWVRLSNNIVLPSGRRLIQYVCVKTIGGVSFFSETGGPELSLDFDTSILAMEKMIAHPDKPLHVEKKANRVSVTSELIESVYGKKPVQKSRYRYGPRTDWSIEEIVDWLKSKGVTEGREYTNGAIEIPKSGELMWHKGPCISGIPKTFWIDLACTPPHDSDCLGMYVTLWPIESRGRITAKIRGVWKESKSISFSEAVELWFRMLENPGQEPVDLNKVDWR